MINLFTLNGKHTKRPQLALGPFPGAHDAMGWAEWWHEWARLGRLGGRLDPAGALFEPLYPGDHLLDLPERGVA